MKRRPISGTLKNIGFRRVERWSRELDEDERLRQFNLGMVIAIAYLCTDGELSGEDRKLVIWKKKKTSRGTKQEDGMQCVVEELVLE